METNSRLPLTVVTTITKDMLEFITDKPHKIVNISKKLNDEEYTTIIVCEDNENMNEYCHITTYKSNSKKDEISFHKDDDYPVKAEFDKSNSYIEYFFKSFIDFRNSLIKSNQRVKSDDIYQYFMSVTGFTEKDRIRKKQKFQKIRVK